MNTQDQGFLQFLQSGKKILTDTKTPKRAQVQTKKLAPPKPEEPLDPHQRFVKKCIADKPSKKVLIEFFEDIIKSEEAKL